MTTLDEFAQILTQNRSHLAEIYAQLLAEADKQYATMPPTSRTAAGRKLLGAVIEAFETGQSGPLCRLFSQCSNGVNRGWPAEAIPANPVLELTCLEQTLSPVVTSREAGSFLRQVLAEVQASFSSPAGIDLPEPDGIVTPLTAEAPQQAALDSATAAASDDDEINPALLANYDAQLRNESFYYILFITVSAAVTLGSINFFVYSFDNPLGYLWLVVYIMAPLLVGSWSWKLAKKGKQRLGAWLFIYVHLLLITFSFTQSYTVIGPLPYLFGYFIVISSTIVQPQASFTVWFSSVILLFGALLYRGQFFANLLILSIPSGVNLLLAVGSFFTTLDWQEAVQSTAILHLRAQRRRDELFAAQDELRRAHAKQRALYTQLLTSAEVGQRIAALIDLDELLGQVVDLIRVKLEFAYVGIFLLEGDSSLRVRTQSSDIATVDGQKQPISPDQQNVLALAVKERQYVVNFDVRNKQFAPHPYFSSRALSEIALPLITGNHLYGVLNIQSYGGNAFGEENLPIVRLLANQVAIGLRNAQLFNDAVLAREEAERANDIKSRFLASMSHELRTPLNAILNFTGFVADGVFGPVSAEQTDALETTLDSGAHLLSLINDVLDLAKVESGAMDMFVEEVDMQALLKSTAATATGLLKNKPVILKLEVDEDLPAIAGDKRRLRQILLNLVSNAVKYTKEGSITLTAHQHDDTLQLSVQDTGIGIAAEDQSLVFESFHQAESSHNELGTGLGLSIAKHFVEAHGGQIWFESEVGIGTTFYVNLPLTFARDQYTISSAQRD